ncbi:MAG TPA: hypothetical protein VFP61_10435 [Acidimicrobiales bacterium]|nr:hypothetical protein [Acidimicrobiales bacterium]
MQEPGSTVSPGADLRVLEVAAATLDRVDALLARIDGGTYGRCERCGGPIADADLAADPLIDTCGTHRPAAPLPLAPA